MGIQKDICQAIDNSGASLYRVAKDAGVDYATVYRFYHGWHGARLTTVDPLADYFGLKLQPVAKVKRKKGSTK